MTVLIIGSGLWDWFWNHELDLIASGWLGSAVALLWAFLVYMTVLIVLALTVAGLIKVLVIFGRAVAEGWHWR